MLTDFHGLCVSYVYQSQTIDPEVIRGYMMRQAFHSAFILEIEAVVKLFGLI
jgi:hypothetical protein